MTRASRGQDDGRNTSDRSHLSIVERRFRKAMVSRVQTVLCRTRKQATNRQREQVLKILLTKDAVTICETQTLLSEAGQTVSLGTVSRTMKLLCSIGFVTTTQYGDQTWYQLIPLDRRYARMVSARGARTR